MTAPKPIFYAIAGGPGAGKTSFVHAARQMGILPATAFVHDCDAVMLGMPEYQATLAEHGAAKALATWELPARKLAEEQLHQQIAAKQDVIYDRTCALPATYELLADLVKNQVYELVMFALYAPIDLALQRSAQREQETQRHTPPAIVIERAVQFASLWPQYLQLAAEALVLHGSTEDRPLIARYVRDSGLEVYDQTGYDQFKNLAHIQQEK